MAFNQYGAQGFGSYPMGTGAGVYTPAYARRDSEVGSAPPLSPRDQELFTQRLGDPEPDRTFKSIKTDLTGGCSEVCEWGKRDAARVSESNARWTKDGSDLSPAAKAELLRKTQDMLKASLQATNTRERILKLESESDRQWDKVNSKETFSRAGLTKEDAKQIQSLSGAETKERVATSKIGLTEGEAAYLSYAHQFSTWADDRLKGSEGLEKTDPSRFQALQDMKLGGAAYVRSRGDFLQLNHDAHHPDL